MLLDFGGKDKRIVNCQDSACECGGFQWAGRQGCCKAGGLGRFSLSLCEGTVECPGRIPPSDKLCGLALTVP